MFSATIDFSTSAGTLKPLHGVNNGPVTLQGLVDVSDYYREAAIPWVRIHDSNWPHPREVDIPQIFPNPDADPENPANYDFSRTDAYLQSILDTGAKIVYRLGTSIEHSPRKYHTHPPKNFDRWAAICRNVIRHYNHGWADGFHHNITHWEIWNEPDIGDCMWAGSFEQYLQLYATTSRTLKALDSSLQIGGFAVGYVQHEGKIPQFLAYCREHRLPLDFFSWHLYNADPAQFVEHARVVRRLLDEYGFHATTSHLNEWNRHIGPWGRGREYERRAYCEMLKNHIGASFAASVLIALQDAPVDVANYYDGSPSSPLCGLFDIYGVPQKTFSAFRAFETMLGYPERLRVTLHNSPIRCLAAIDRPRNKAAVLLSKYVNNEYSKNDGRYTGEKFEFLNLPAGMDVRQILILDCDRDLQPVRIDQVCKAPPTAVEMSDHSVALLLLAEKRG
ncbi:MAG: hypothetical protein WC058_13220 [Phycisphaeraceae bacterium]